MSDAEQRSYEVVALGAERQPLVVIDDFAADPEALVSAAAQANFGRLAAHYPGVQANADATYLQQRGALLERVLREQFGVQTGARLVSCSYSLVTTPPANLSPLQSLPHFDTTDPGRLAVLHYLCGPEHGGTGFYRHRGTGFESVSEARFGRYRAALAREAGASGMPPPGYIRGATAQFELLHMCPAVFNRLIIYRSMTLHSGAIPAGASLSADPRRGRLTLNTFLDSKR